MDKCGKYRAKFGESPIWHNHFGLIWLDIPNKKIITYNPETNEEKIYDALGWLKALIPTEDGQFIGAVTHVLVGDPTRGYGILIGNMLSAAGA